MKLLTRHLAAGIAGAFLVTFASLCFFFVLIDLLTKRLDDVLQYAVPWSVVPGYYAALLPAAVISYHLAGFAILVAVLAVMSNHARHNEYTAMLAAGIPLYRQAMPALGISAGVAVCILAVSQWVTPRTERQVRLFEAEYFSSSVLSYWGIREPVSWTNLEGNWTCHITKFNRVALSGEEVFLLSLQPDRDEHIRARRIFWDADRDAWILEDGSWAVYRPQPGIEGASALTERRIAQVEAPLQETPEDLFQPFEPPSGFATSELPEVIRLAEARHTPVRPLSVEFHTRFAGATLPVVMALIAVPLATRIQRGGRSAAIAVAVGLALAYFVFFSVSVNLGRIGRLDPVVSAWLANAVFGVGGLALLGRGAT